MDVWSEYPEIFGNKQLYGWQRECLRDVRLVEHRENFILSLPTGAGKTLVAELLMLREALVRQKNCILILPYVAIVQEKVTTMAYLEENFRVVVEEYAAAKGRFPPIKRRNLQSIYLCTIEKANALVNTLFELNRISEIGMVIVDELHMLGESGGRGAILEQCLCKLMHLSLLKTSERIQIVGMSATMGNTSELCQFLSANLYRTDFRPVKLLERIKIQDKLFVVDESGNWQLEREFPKNKGTEKRDPDGIVKLLGNLIKGQVLIFCPTKQNCENVCRMLASMSPRELREHKVEERMEILAQLREEHDGHICPVLSSSIKHGVAYHHSGLTQDERLLVETAYKSGIISIICCTSTLAAGVNLPARRVIIRSPLVGKELLKKSQYLQMVGRAGRAGLGEKGDSIIILHQGAEATNFKKVHEAPLEPCLSGLSDELQRESYFLDLIVLKLCSSMDDLVLMLTDSLLGIQQKYETQIRALAEKTVQSLLAKNMINQPEGIFYASPIGSATFNANLIPQVALDMNRDLGENLGQGIVLSSHFHLLYNCVPLDVEVQIDWNIFHNEYLTLTREERQMIHSMGFTEATIVQYILSSNANKGIFTKAMRFYVAFMLRQLWNKTPLWEVALRFGVPRGWLQGVLQSAISQSSSIVRFAERTPELWSLKSLLPEMVKLLSVCTRQEIIPLLAIECMKMARARQLYDKGYRNVGSIAKAQPQHLVMALDSKLNYCQAKRMINSAKNIIRDHIAEKTEELEELGAEDAFILPRPAYYVQNISISDAFNQSRRSRMSLNKSGLEEEEEEEENLPSANAPNNSVITINL